MLCASSPVISALPLYRLPGAAQAAGLTRDCASTTAEDGSPCPFRITVKSESIRESMSWDMSL